MGMSFKQWLAQLFPRRQARIKAEADRLEVEYHKRNFDGYDGSHEVSAAMGHQGGMAIRSNSGDPYG